MNLKTLFPTDEYPYRHWLATVLIGPLLYIVFGAIESGKPAWTMYPLVVFMGMLFSLPTFLVYLLSYNYLSLLRLHYMALRLMLSGIAIVGIVISNYLMKGTQAPYIGVTYSIAAFIGTFLIRRKFQQKRDEAS